MEERKQFLKTYIAAKVQQMKALRHDYENPRNINNSIADVEKQISDLQAKRVELIHRRDNAKALYFACSDEIDAKAQELLQLEHAAKIAKLRSLAGQIAELSQ